MPGTLRIEAARAEGLDVTADERFILITANDHETAEARLIPAATPTATTPPSPPSSSTSRAPRWPWPP